MHQLERTNEESKTVPQKNRTWDSTPKEVEVGAEESPY